MHDFGVDVSMHVVVNVLGELQVERDERDLLQLGGRCEDRKTFELRIQQHCDIALESFE